MKIFNMFQHLNTRIPNVTVHMLNHTFISMYNVVHIPPGADINFPPIITFVVQKCVQR